MKKEVALFLGFEGALSEAVTRGDLSFDQIEKIFDFSQDAYERLLMGEKVEVEGFPELSTLEASATALLNKFDNADKQGYPNA